MARKPNYQFEKRQKELDRKARKEEKLRRRQERATDGDPADPAETGRPADDAPVSERPGGTPTSDS
jgi:hypothetical protein